MAKQDIDGILAGPEVCKRIGGMVHEEDCIIKESWLREIKTDCGSVKGTLDEVFDHHPTDEEVKKKISLCSMKLEDLSRNLTQDQITSLENKAEGMKDIRHQVEEQNKAVLRNLKIYQNAYSKGVVHFLRKKFLWSKLP